MAEEKQMILNIEMGRCVSGDGTDVLKCYACGEAAAPWPWADSPGGWGYGYVRINGGELRPICEECSNDKSQDAEDAIVRKFLSAPDLEIEQGGMVH
jgi:hypothetical protein